MRVWQRELRRTVPLFCYGTRVLSAVYHGFAPVYGFALRLPRLLTLAAGVVCVFAALTAAQRFRIASAMALRPAALRLRLRFRFAGAGAAASVAGLGFSICRSSVI